MYIFQENIFAHHDHEIYVVDKSTIFLYKLLVGWVNSVDTGVDTV